MMTIILRGSGGRRHIRPQEREAGAFRACMASLLLLLVLVQQQSSLCSAYSVADFLAAYNNPSVHIHEVKGEIVLTASLPPLTKAFKLVGKRPDNMMVRIDGAGKTGIRTTKDLTLEKLDFYNFKTHRNGAALEATGGKVVIQSCAFTENHANGAQAAGGAIWFQSVNFKITDSQFFRNRAGTLGGAIYSDKAVAGLVQETTFNDNQATGSGGAIASFKGSQIRILQCPFDANKAVTRYGGALHFDKDTAFVKDSMFSGNVAGRMGGAIRFIGDSVHGSLTMCSGNTIIDNTATPATSSGISVSINFGAQQPSVKAWFCGAQPAGTLIEPATAAGVGCRC